MSFEEEQRNVRRELDAEIKRLKADIEYLQSINKRQREYALSLQGEIERLKIRSFEREEE